MRSSFNAGEVQTSPALLDFFGGPDSRPVPDPLSDDADQDVGDLPTGVDEDALDADDLDTDEITSPS